MKRNPNYELKSIVMRLGLCKIVANYDFISAETDFIKIMDIQEAYLEAYQKYGYEYIKEARRVNKANYQRIKRLNEKIKLYLESGQCIFATLTFRDDVLESTNSKTRRKYVARFLKSVSDKYIANIDFGMDDSYTKREHYHAVVLTDKINDIWDYGFAWYERVHRTNDPKCLTKYLSKLTNHAIKYSFNRYIYIYSKNIQ